MSGIMDVLPAPARISVLFLFQKQEESVSSINQSKFAI
jgi:hypothetical protein